MTDAIPVNEIIAGNCAEVMAGWPDECIELTVTSPPYDNLRDYEGYTFDFEAIAKQLYRITKPGGVVVWVVGDATVDGSETGTSFRQVLHFLKLGFNLHDTMIYRKSGSSYPSQDRYYQVFEFMFVLSKGRPQTINLIADRKNRWNGSWGKRSRRNRSGELVRGDKTPSGEYGVRFNVWQIDGGKGFSTKDEFAYDHPAIFPEALARDHIISWSNPGDIVLDPMCGSGTTLKMARQTGRKFVGIDISDEYCTIAKRRVEGAQLPLFVDTHNSSRTKATLGDKQRELFAISSDNSLERIASGGHNTGDQYDND